MGKIIPIYRMRIFQTGSASQPDVVLTPAPSAPHAFKFQVATTGSVGGYYPYMDPPSGRKTSFNPVSKKTTIGTIKVRVGDPKITTGSLATGSMTANLQRFTTAFFGTEDGKLLIRGAKTYIEESVDGGATFQPWFLGNIDTVTDAGGVAYDITIKSLENNLKNINLFENEPSASVFVDRPRADAYGNRFQVMPYGPNIKYAFKSPLPKAVGTVGTVESNATLRAIGIDHAVADNSVDGVAWGSKALTERVPLTILGENAELQLGSTINSPILRTTTGKRFRVVGLVIAPLITGNIFKPLVFIVEALDSSEFEYAPITDLVYDSSISFEVLIPGPASDDAPMLIQNVNPISFLQDILDGAWGPLDSDTHEGLFRFETDEYRFNELRSKNNKYREFRAQYTEPREAKKVVENDICQVYDLGLRYRPVSSSDKILPRYEVFDMAMPSGTAGMQTITEQDLIAGSVPSWEPGELYLRFDHTLYKDDYNIPKNVLTSIDGLEMAENPSLITESEFSLIDIVVENIGRGDKKLKVDAKGIRFSPGETILWTYTGQDNLAIKYGQEVQEAQRYRWSRGPATIGINTHRTGSTNTLDIGDWRLVDVAILPDPYQHQRGGTRLMQCIERRDDGPEIFFRLIDSGQNIQSTAPSVGSFAQITPLQAISGSVAVTSRVLVEGAYAATPVSASSRPSENDSNWIRVYSQVHNSGSQNVTFNGLPENSKIWPRFRTKPAQDGDLQLPSDWAYPSNDFVTLSGFGAPTNVTVHDITSISARVNWTPGASTGYTDVLLQPASSASFEKVLQVPIATREVTISGLSSAGSENPYTVGVRHRALQGGTTTIASASFTATGSADECPIPSVWPTRI